VERRGKGKEVMEKSGGALKSARGESFVYIISTATKPSFSGDLFLNYFTHHVECVWWRGLGGVGRPRRLGGGKWGED
jgi:hypothetical protein